MYDDSVFPKNSHCSIFCKTDYDRKNIFVPNIGIENTPLSLYCVYIAVPGPPAFFFKRNNFGQVWYSLLKIVMEVANFPYDLLEYFL